MKDYFKNKSAKDFKNSKLFWRFYSSSIKIKSEKSGQKEINLLKDGESSAADSASICDMFNCFFTSLKSNSLSSKYESEEFVSK